MTNQNNSLRILIIEDNPGDFELVQTYLSEYILPSIVHAESFKEASSILSDSSARFDIILLDLTLPDKSGTGLITEVLDIAGDCPVIILTGYSDLDFSIQSIYLGISDYLLKDNITSVNLFKSISYSVQRKKKIHELMESEKRYTDLFQFSPQPMFVFDTETFKFIQVNNAAITHYGYSEPEFLNMTILDIRPQNKIVEVKELIIKNAQEEVEIFTGRSTHCKKSKEEIEVEIYSSPITLNDKSYRLVIAIDVTEKIVMQEIILEYKIQEQNKITKAVINAQEKERAEIGEELHDNVNQLLAASKLYLNHSLSCEGDKTEFILKGQEYVAIAISEIRKLSHALVGVVDKETTLCDSIDELVKSISVVENIAIAFTCPNYEDDTFGTGLKQTIYRIVQEQLNNILKYAAATKAEIEIMHHNDDLLLTINDNGKGFNTLEKSTGIGLKNIKNRAAVYNGEVHILSSVGNGCKMKVIFKGAQSEKIIADNDINVLNK
jgi:PAS domain S-box-containing protein